MQLLLKCSYCWFGHLMSRHGYVRRVPLFKITFDEFRSSKLRSTSSVILNSTYHRFPGHRHLRLTFVSHTYFTCLYERALACVFHLFLVAKDGSCTLAAPARAFIHYCRPVIGSVNSRSLWQWHGINRHFEIWTRCVFTFSESLSQTEKENELGFCYQSIRRLVRRKWIWFLLAFTWSICRLVSLIM